MQRPQPQENLREVIRRAFEALEGRDAESVAADVCGRAVGGVVEIELLGRKLAVDLAAREVRDSEGVQVDEYVAAVVARHLSLAPRLPLVGSRTLPACPSGGQGRRGDDLGPEVSFAEDNDARGYQGPFRGRVLGPFLGRFGSDPDAFARAAEALGAERVRDFEEVGAVAFRIRVFPRVPLVFILHPGDDEFPPDGQVLFPREVLRAFDVEDAVTTAELTGRALRGAF